MPSAPPRLASSASLSLLPPLPTPAPLQKNRGNYRCSRCNLPKKGHVCPFQPRLKRKDLPEGSFKDAMVQVELDKDMVVRSLALDRQGLPESYMVVKNLMQQGLEQQQQLPPEGGSGSKPAAGGGGASTSKRGH